MTPKTGTGERYESQMGELWSGLTRTLGHLDRLAAEPGWLDAEIAPGELRRLQYGLHLAGERAYGLSPPPGSEETHAELWASLADARDATADVADALEDDGPDGIDSVLHEWRGALFRVRLARLQLSGPKRKPEVVEEDERPSLRPPLVACVLVAAGAAAFALGATIGHWPLWAAGILALCGGTISYRP